MWKLRWQAAHLFAIMKRGLRSWPSKRAAWQRYWRSLAEYQRLAAADRKADPRRLYPCPGDDIGVTPVEPIYFYQDAWAFEKIVNVRPSLHVDVGSHHKFVSLLSKLVPVIMVDIRPLTVSLDSITFKQGSILDLPFGSSSLPSVSSVCVIEHIGLGRYGDELDPFGSERAMEELKRVVAPGGDLLISVPLDDFNRTYFNAHRAFHESYLLRLFEPFEILEARYIYGAEFLTSPRPGFGTGCYHLRAPK